MEDRKHYRTVIISDVHIGSAHSKVKEAADFLEKVECSRLILNGDIIDGWQLQKKSADKRWSPEYTRFANVIMKMMEEYDTDVVYLRGNTEMFSTV